MIKFFTSLLFLISINFYTNAQVGINTESPSTLSVLDIHNLVSTVNGVKDTIPQGILIPRLSKAKIDAIDVKDLDEANSLLVYNVDEDCYNFFSKTEEAWVSVCGGDKSGGKSTFTINCNKVTVSGTYQVNETLTSSNYLSVEVEVTKAGSYTISATSTNGYFFYKTAEFLDKGTYTVRLEGTGTPKTAGTNTIPIIHTSSATSTCSAVVTVVNPASSYTLACDSTKVMGVYEVGQTLGTSHKIQMYVNVSAIGGWSIESNTVDGISFAGSGTFTKTGNQWITVVGKGMPTTDASKKMTLLVKSSSNDGSAASAFCTAYVKMTLSSKLIGSVGIQSSMITGSGSQNVAYISALFRSPYNFGTQDNSTIKMHSPTNSQTLLNPFTNSNGSTGKQLSNILYNVTGKKALDALFISYSGGLADQAAADTMTNYLQKGGVLILLSSQIEASQRPSYLTSTKRISTVGTGNLALMRNLFGPQVTNVLSTFNPGDTWRLPMVSNDDTSLNGPFGDVRNCYLIVSDITYPSKGSSVFVEGVVAVSYDGIPINKLDWVITATNYNSGTATLSSNIVGFKASGYNFIWLADPNLFYYYNLSGNKSGTIADLENITYRPIDMPAKYDKNRSPFPTSNSRFLANLLAWAMERAEYNGINSK